ncbi:MAG: secretin N-terminal domain-containing protein [Planctomycetota bacterium]
MNPLKTLIALAVSAAALMPAAPAQVPSLDARVDLDIVEKDLSLVVEFLRNRSGANIVILQGGDKKVEALKLSDVYWRDALEYAAEVAGCVVEEDKSGVLTISEPKRVSFVFDEVDLREVISTIATVADADIIMGAEVQGIVRTRLDGVPWKVALDGICKTMGYTVVEEGRGFFRVVDPVSLEQQKITRSYQLRYLRPRSTRVAVINSEFMRGGSMPPEGPATEHFTALAALEKALSDSGELDFIEAQNVIIVRDTTQVHETIQEIIRRLDVEPSQIFVDLKFVSTSNSDILNLGVDYGDEGPQVSISGSQIPIALPFTMGEGGFEDAIIADSLGFGPVTQNTGLISGSQLTIPNTIFGALSFNQVQATLRMLQQDQESEVIQAPKIITLDGNEATIFVGETVRYAEAQSEQGQAGGLQLTVQEAAGSPVEIGFQLLVTPHVIPGTRKIQMEVVPKETNLSGTGQTALAPAGFDVFTVGSAGSEGSIALPRTRSSTMLTTLMLESGQTAVIGGLTTDNESTTVTRVPYLSRVPLLGELFKFRNESRDRRSLLIFITPTLVHSADDAEFLLQQELQRRRNRLADEVEALQDSADPID